LNFKVCFWAFCFSLCAFTAGSANTLPSAEDVNRLSDTVKFTVDAFMQQSFEPRMEFEYYGEFPTEADKNKLYQSHKRIKYRRPY